MAREVRTFAVTVPVGGTAAAPQHFDLSFPPRAVARVDVRIPPGPSGQVGFALAMSGQQIVPYQRGAFVVGDDDRLTYDLTDFPDSGAWSLHAYNLGVFPHTLEVTFHLEVTQQQGPAPVVVIDPSILAGAFQ